MDEFNDIVNTIRNQDTQSFEKLLMKTENGNKCLHAYELEKLTGEIIYQKNHIMASVLNLYIREHSIEMDKRTIVISIWCAENWKRSHVNETKGICELPDLDVVYDKYKDMYGEWLTNRSLTDWDNKS
jgi:predicted neuraminidase